MPKKDRVFLRAGYGDGRATAHAAKMFKHILTQIFPGQLIFLGCDITRSDP